MAIDYTADILSLYAGKVVTEPEYAAISADLRDQASEQRILTTIEVLRSHLAIIENRTEANLLLESISRLTAKVGSGGFVYTPQQISVSGSTPHPTFTPGSGLDVIIGGVTTSCDTPTGGDLTTVISEINGDLSGATAEVSQFTALVETTPGDLGGTYLTINGKNGAPTQDYYVWFNHAARPEITDVTTRADSSGDLNSKYWNLEAPGPLPYYVWYEVTLAEFMTINFSGILSGTLPLGGYVLTPAQDETNYDGAAGNGTFVAGNASFEFISSQDETNFNGAGSNGSFISGDGNFTLVAAQDETDYTGGAPNGSFVGGNAAYDLKASQDETNYNGAGSNGTFVGGDSLVTLTTTQDETDYDGAGSNGTFAGGTGFTNSPGADDGTTVTLTGGSVITIGTVVAGAIATFSVTTAGAAFDGSIRSQTGTTAPSGGTGVSLSPAAANFTGDYEVSDTITLSDGSVLTVDAVNTSGDVTQFTVTTPAASANPTGTLTQSGTSGTGNAFTLTPGNANLDNVYRVSDTITVTDGSIMTVDAVDANGDVTQFTITTADPTGFVGVLSQTATSGDGDGFTMTPDDNNYLGKYKVNDTITLSDGTVVTVDAVVSDGDVSQFTVTTPFVGGNPSGAQTQSATSGNGNAFTLTPGAANLTGKYVASDTITLSDGSVITVDAVDANGDVTQFTVTTPASVYLTAGVPLTQSSTSGNGDAYTLTPQLPNFNSITPFAAWFDVTTSPTATSPNKTYRFWYSDTGVGTTAPAAGGTTLVPIPFTGAEPTDIALAGLTAGVIAGADPDFAAAANSGLPVVSLVLATVGDATDHADGAPGTGAAFGRTDGIDAGADPAPGGTGIKVSISGNASAAAVAAATAPLVGGDANFTISGGPAGPNFQVTNAANGPVTGSAIGTSGFPAVTQNQNGLNAAVDPAAANNAVAVNYTVGSAAGTIGGEVRAAITAQAGAIFSTGGAGATINVTNILEGDAPDATAGTSGWAAPIVTDGTAGAPVAVEAYRTLDGKLGFRNTQGNEDISFTLADGIGGILGVAGLAAQDLVSKKEEVAGIARDRALTVYTGQKRDPSL